MENIKTNIQTQKPLKMALDVELGILSSIENVETGNDNKTKEEKETYKR